MNKCSNLQKSNRETEIVVMKQSELNKCIPKNPANKFQFIVWQQTDVIANIMTDDESDQSYLFRTWSNLGFNCGNTFRDSGGHGNLIRSDLHQLSERMDCSCAKEVSGFPQCDAPSLTGQNLRTLDLQNWAGQNLIQRCNGGQGNGCQCKQEFKWCPIKPGFMLKCTVCISESLNTFLEQQTCNTNTNNKSYTKSETNMVTTTMTSTKIDNRTNVPQTKSGTNSSTIALIVGISSGTVTILFVIAIVIFLKRKTASQAMSSDNNPVYGIYGDTYATTEMADNNSDYGGEEEEGMTKAKDNNSNYEFSMK